MHPRRHIYASPLWMRYHAMALCFLLVGMFITPLMGSSNGAIANSLSAPTFDTLPLPFANPAFQRVWARTDIPVASGQVHRSFYWGPAPDSPGLMEDYAEGVEGKRLVQYFDKSRMEINNPNGNPDDPFYVTNGLLAVELISGKMQVGNSTYVDHAPADIPLASDTDDPNAPTYHSFQGVANTPLGDHLAPNKVGQAATSTISKDGTVDSDPSKASDPGVVFAFYTDQTKHNIPKVIWDFLNLSGPVYNSSIGKTTDEPLSNPWFYATGYPISEPYWAKVKIANEPNTDVLIQVFERRTITYVPSAPAGFEVQMGNIGQHYYDWRYNGAGGNPPGPTAVSVTPVLPAPTPTPATLPVVFEDQFYHPLDLERAAKEQWGQNATLVSECDGMNCWKAMVGTQLKDLDLKRAVSKQYGSGYTIALVGVQKYDWRAVRFADLNYVILPVMLIASEYVTDIDGVRTGLAQFESVLANTQNWYYMRAGRTYRLLQPLVVPTGTSSAQWNATAESTTDNNKRDALGAAAIDAYKQQYPLPGNPLRVVAAPYTGASVNIWHGAVSQSNFAVVAPRETSLMCPLSGLLTPECSDASYAIGHELGHNFALNHSCDDYPTDPMCGNSIMQTGKPPNAILLQPEIAKLQQSPFFTRY